MPLKSGKSNIGPNIKELEKPSVHAPKGRPYAQALAIALKTARVPKRANGGHVGALRGSTGGRADDIQTSVPDGSHIIPADVVSALGDGNTEAGFAKLEKMFPASRAFGGRMGMKGMPSPMKGVPHMVDMPKPGGSKTGMPHMPGMSKMPGMPRMGRAHGGSVKVALSDGEFAVPPEQVVRVGRGDAERGHRALDFWTVNTRKTDIERRKRLPGPVGSGL